MKISSHCSHDSVKLFIDSNSKILMLGSFPSVKSRENNFFYMHPSNRFYATLANIFGEKEPKSIQERQTFLRNHQIALYDVLEECDIYGSSDSSITNVKPSNIAEILNKYPNIRCIFLTGGTAFKLFEKYTADTIDAPYFGLFSTSSANCRISQEKLNQNYSVILNYLV